MGQLRIPALVVIAQFILVSCVVAQHNVLLNGTIIITFTSRDTIWVGADSRTSSLTDKGYTANKEGMCKIYSTNDVVYAMAGHVRYADNSFNFLDIMQTSIQEQKDFEKSMEVFRQRTETEIRSVLRKFSRKSISTLIKLNKGAFLTVVAISFVNGEKKMKEMGFSIDAVSNNHWNVIYKERDVNSEGSIRFFGHGATASEYIRNNSFYFGNGTNIPQKINDLIKLESTKSSTTVGMPADVISIYNNGYKRVINSGLCSEVSPQ